MIFTRLSKEIDWLTFAVSFTVVMLSAVSLLIAPEASSTSIAATFRFITERCAQLYLWSGLGALTLLLALALSPLGRIRLGNADDRPTHSVVSWAGMLFSTGIGTAVLYWSTIEWIEYYQSPPFDIQARTPEAMQWATSYGMFHWGLIGWAFYALAAVCIAHAYHVRKESSLSLAFACRPLLKGHTTRWPGRLINAVFMIGLIGSASTGLGLTTPLITESFNTFFGIKPNFVHTIGAIALVIALIAVSVSVDLDHGIKRLSNINLGLMLALLASIVVWGPTSALFRQGANSIQFMLTHLPEMSGLRYPAENKTFTESWTVFYWAWWMAMAPFVGIFITKISSGRTLGQLVWGVLGFGTLGCTLCFVVFGGYANHLSEVEGTDIIATFNDKSKHQAVIAIMTSLPIGRWILPLFFLLCLSFAATTYDSASYTLAAAATRRVGVDEDPPRWQRVLWALVLGVLPLTLLSLGKQSDVLVPLQTASVVVSLPVMLVGLLMVTSLALALFRTKS